jgi:glycosyltransferase involved in cell wall biosynthesis
MNKTNPKISIITASYNYAQYISETIESVINQTYSNWELIIVDDGSIDNSVEIIKDYCLKDDRIKLYQHPEGINKGLKETILLGLKYSTANWVAFLESDDIFLPTNLEEKVKIINSNSKALFIFNDIELFGDSNLKNPYMRDFYAHLKHEGFLNLRSVLRRRNPVATFSSVLLKKSLLKNIDFNSPIKPILDYYLWLQVAKHTHFYYLPKKLTKWRQHSDSYIFQIEMCNKKEWHRKVITHCPYMFLYFLRKVWLVFRYIN